MTSKERRTMRAQRKAATLATWDAPVRDGKRLYWEKKVQDFLKIGGLRNIRQINAEALTED